MDRRAFVAAAFTLAAHATAARARTNGLRRIGFLSGGSTASPPSSDRFHRAYLDRLQALGYVEGRNVAHEWRFADGRFDRLPGLARELVAWRPDVLVARTTPGALAARDATSTLPIVIVGVADPVGAGLVPSLGRPGGNVTGTTNNVAELAGKRLALLKEVLPPVRQVAVLANTDDPNTPLQMEHARRAADSLALKLHPVLVVRREGDFDGAVKQAQGEGAQAAIRFVDPTVTRTRRAAVDASLRHRLPIVFAFREDAEAGGLLSYGTDLADQFARTADYVHRILQGARPGELPVEQARKFELVVNVATARALALAVPAAVVQRADIVIR